MVVQNYGALVFLAIAILIGAVIMGFLLTDTEIFNPTNAIQKAHADATSSALIVRATEIALQAIETPTAFNVQRNQTQTIVADRATQTRQAIVVQETAIPVQQTATRVAVLSVLAVDQVNATRTAIASEVENKVLQARATQTRIAQEQYANVEQTNASATRVALTMINQKEEHEIASTREMLITVLSVIAIGTITSSIVYVLIAFGKAKEKEAAAMAEREKRRTLEVQLLAGARKETPRITVVHPQQYRVPRKGDQETERAA